MFLRIIIHFSIFTYHVSYPTIFINKHIDILDTCRIRYTYLRRKVEFYLKSTLNLCVYIHLYLKSFKTYDALILRSRIRVRHVFVSDILGYFIDTY